MFYNLSYATKVNSTDCFRNDVEIEFLTSVGKVDLKLIWFFIWVSLSHTHIHKSSH